MDCVLHADAVRVDKRLVVVFDPSAQHFHQEVDAVNARRFIFNGRKYFLETLVLAELVDQANKENRFAFGALCCENHG